MSDAVKELKKYAVSQRDIKRMFENWKEALPYFNDDKVWVSLQNSEVIELLECGHLCCLVQVQKERERILEGIKRLRQGELDDEAHTDWETEQGRGYIQACDRIKKLVSGDEG